MSERTSHRGLVVFAIMASMAMIAIEATIVSTAMPQIAAQLGQINLYSWVFSAFLLTQTVTAVVFGKLACCATIRMRIALPRLNCSLRMGYCLI
ncbi:hypothetical protein ASC97_23660 [Rhizobium sp. Root1203]|nr:hypothetical protein ASC97_23660 [Rhizobium sp. Root1203]